MDNVIFSTYDARNQIETISIGSYEYMLAHIEETQSQLCWVLGIHNTEEEREEMMEMEQQELYNWMLAFKQKHELFVERPN